MRIPVIATVECRSEAAGEQHPIAVTIGGKRISVDAVLSDGIAGPGLAGGRTERRVVVKLESEDVLHLQRVLPDGEWRVYRR